MVRILSYTLLGEMGHFPRGLYGDRRSKRSSALTERRVIQGQLIVCRRLEDASIPLHVTLGDGDAADGVTSHDPPHQLIVGRIEETEFDRYAERSCGLALLVALRASPETPFEHNRDSQQEEPLRKLPEFPFEPGLEALVERI